MTTPFREQVARDFDQVFLNAGEFGHVCQWNGAPLKVVDGASPAPIGVDETVGILADSREIYCCWRDLVKPPVANEIVNIDGEFWQVVDIRKPLEHYIITLSRLSS